MPRRLWFSLGTLALGAGLLATAQLAGAARGWRQGGVFRVGMTGASVQIDPQLAYVSTAWWLEYATAAKLFNYPDRAGAAGGLLRPEVASRYTVSSDGRTWTLFVRKGFRFSDGSPVTAASFAYAIDRVANHDLASPGAPFITDAAGTNIVGAKDVTDGKATHVRGVVVKGNRLIIHLTRPDGSFATKLAMPYFQATSRRLPLKREVLTGYPSAGPYFMSHNEPNVSTELRRNAYYRGTRPRHLSGVELQWNLGEEAAYQRVRDGGLDESTPPDAHVQELASTFGVNRTRFWSKPDSCLGTIAFNEDRPLFRNNALRRALNWAVDRKAYAAAAGPYAAMPWTHLLSPTVPGSVTARRLQPYADAPDLRKARRLARGHLRSGVVNIGYRSSVASGLAQAQLIRDALVNLGVQPQRIKLKGFAGADLYGAMGKRHTDLDLGVGLGWCADSSDADGPFGLIRLHGSLTPRYERKLAVAKRLRGIARLRAFGKLDVDLMNEVAPVVVMRTYNAHFFFSGRVDPRRLVYEGVYSDWSILALALK
jgi:peptide/nickel transport system substrate-binding protein